MVNSRAMPWVVVMLWMFSTVVVATEAARSKDWPKDEGKERRREKNIFLLRELKRVVKTKAGDMTVARSYGGRMVERPLHIGFITMKPHSLFIPQYLDSTIILFVRQGEAKIGSIHKDELMERQLKEGDVYRIAAGSAFYMVNTGQGQKLRIVCSIDPSDSLGLGGAFQSFFVGGGINTDSVISGFNPKTLSAAFNVSMEELREIMTRQHDGPIIYTNRQPSVWSEFLHPSQKEKLKHKPNEQQQQQQQQQSTWSWRKLLNTFFVRDRERAKTTNKKTVEGSESYNLYDQNPDFKNDYGWSIALDESDYSPLHNSGMGIYFVNLTAGSMLAPHVNPSATEYGVVLRGSGSIQVVFPNGTGTEATMEEGSVFWIPKYFPFCQIASRSGPIEILGFTTSPHKNHPQFLIGSNSLLNNMRGAEMAAAFGVSEEKFKRVTTAQREAVILPLMESAEKWSEAAAEEEGVTASEAMISSVGSEMAMGFA